MLHSRALLLAMVPLIALAGWACGGGDDDGDDAPPTATPVVATPTTAAPVATPTAGGGSVAIIDAILAAVASGDPAQLEALFVYQRVQCTTETGQGAGGPPICRGEPDGTPVSVAPMASCEGYYAREGELQLEQAVDGTASFHAAYAFDGLEFWAGAAYGVIFVFPAGGEFPQAFSVMASDDGVIGVYYGCGSTAGELAQSPGFGAAIVEPGGD